jgi:hypothetical protein
LHSFSCEISKQLNVLFEIGIHVYLEFLLAERTLEAPWAGRLLLRPFDLDFVRVPNRDQKYFLRLLKENKIAIPDGVARADEGC